MVHVLKASGKLEPFSEEKIKYSIRRAGIPENLKEQVLSHVKEKLYDNIPTSEIYRHITEFLEKSHSPHLKSRYSLKQSIMELGPTGYPFEDFVAKMLESMGYETKTRQILAGPCITHEIDVVIQNGKEKSIIECKFHNSPGTRTDVHVSLYTKARFDDLKKKHGLNSVWIITNTKATLDAIDFARCNDMKIISWDYPSGESLRDLVEKSKLQPLTVLQSLSKEQEQRIMQDGTVLCRDLKPQSLSALGFPQDKVNQVISEANSVCDINI